MSTSYIVGYTPDNTKVITLFSSLSFIYDNDYRDYIKYFGEPSGDYIQRLESIDGSTIDILELKCKSYEELLVQMDMCNLLHNIEIPNEIYTIDAKTDNALKKKTRELAEKNMQLAEENRQLKLKLKRLKNLIDK